LAAAVACGEFEDIFKTGLCVQCLIDGLFMFLDEVFEFFNAICVGGHDGAERSSNLLSILAMFGDESGKGHFLTT
jgi:hypothetical protein